MPSGCLRRAQNRSTHCRLGAVEVARRVHTGTIGINHYLPDPTAPFGGVKASGLGRELGPEGLAAYEQQKSIYLAASASGN